MNRQQQYGYEVRELIKSMIRSTMPAPKMLSCDICFDLPNEFFATAWEQTEVAAGTQKAFIKKAGFDVCKKSDATLLMIIGEKSESGDWIIGRFKNYWLKPSPVS